jgi:tetratricopeptide (TPR) repeat protein
MPPRLFFALSLPFMSFEKHPQKTMTKVARLLCLLLPLAFVPAVPAAQLAPAEVAADEASRRQEAVILLRRTLAADQGLATRDLDAASRLYEEAFRWVQLIGVGIDAETQETISGLAHVRLELAHRAQRRRDFQEASLHINRVLAIDPLNEQAIRMKRDNDRALEALAGRVPSPEVLALAPEVRAQRIQAQTHVQNGKALYEMGRIPEAEAELKQAVNLDPENQAAYYYLKLIAEAKYAQGAYQREVMAKEKGVEVEDAWLPHTQRDLLPTPNPFATTNLVHTGPGRQSIQSKLHRIVLNEVLFDGLTCPTC